MAAGLVSKYAPANDAGEKPYIVEWTEWGREGASLVYAASPAVARYKTCGRMRYKYARRIRRALADEVSAR